MYGITETTVHVTHYGIRRQDAEESASQIGRQLADLRLYILDRNLEPAPIGVAGELFVGGAGVARGYLKRSDLTSDRFIPDQFSREPGARLYRTGDLARHLADGRAEYLGRIDHQVKIRGYRIELGEIAATISEHAAIEQAVVIAREDEPGMKRLVGYYVANRSVTNQQIREYLQARLPDYMAPGSFVQMEKIPLTPNGKIDRRALPKPEPSGESARYVGPRTAVEEILCSIWKRVLKTGNVSILDNFFALGADSLRVMEAVSLAKDAGLQLTTRQFFESQTVSELAQLSQRSEEDGYETSEALLVPARINGSKPPLFLVHPAGGGVDFLWPIAHHLEPDQPFYGFRFKGLSRTEIYKPELEEVAADYLALMKAVQPRGPHLIGGLSLGVYIAFEMARQLQNRGEAVSLLAMIDSGPSGIEGLRDSVPRFPIDLANQYAVDISREEIIAIDPDMRLDYVLKKIKSATSDYDYSQIARIAPAWYGHLWSAERYLSKALADPQSYLYTGKITLFKTPGDADNSMGWSAMSSQDVDINILPGSHGTLLKEPYVGSLARMLTKAILKSEQTPLETISS
jgi:thioesterase domain-containing protein